MKWYRSGGPGMGRHCYSYMFSKGGTNLKDAKGKTVMITGTSSGFGRLSAIALAQEGHKVIATMRGTQKKEELLATARSIGDGVEIEVVELDVTDFTQVNHVIEGVLSRFGKIDVLVNNAGYAAGGFIEEVPMQVWKEQFETNFFGVVALTRAVLPHMRERASGTIINVSSISGRVGFPGLGPYVSSKHAVEGFSESLRLEMLPYGVHVVLVEPASYKTGIWSKGLAGALVQEDSPYVKEMNRMVHGVQRISNSASDPQEVVDLLKAIVSMKSPGLRYPIGKGVRRMLSLKSLLPWKWIETILVKRFQRS
jgi:NAD(P)-dependent dehydrogenase (short-subunit alcohol dehydrogenase family)